MSTEHTIEQFCSRQINRREHHGIEENLVSTSCSRRSHCSHAISPYENMKVIQFVTKCCAGMDVEPTKVINELLSFEDKKEILRGELSEEAMRVFVGMWDEMAC